jgi:hypothetical protein
MHFSCLHKVKGVNTTTVLCVSRSLSIPSEAFNTTTTSQFKPLLPANTEETKTFIFNSEVHENGGEVVFCS